MIRSSGSTLLQERGAGILALDPDLALEAHRAANCKPPFDHLVEADERSAADEQDVRRIDLRKLLMRMFSAALGRNISDGSFQHLQERLLDAFAGNVARDRGVFVLSADLVDLIYIDDAGLGAFDVAAGVLNQSKDDVFNVFADVAGFRQRCRVDDREGHAQQSRQRLGKERLAGSGRADQEDVGFLEFDVGLLSRQLDALVVVVYGDGQLLLRFVLTDDVLVEKCLDLGWLGKVNILGGGFVVLIFIDDVLANADAFITDENGWTCDQLPNFVLTLVAE